MTLTYDLQAMVMSYLHAQVQGQQSVGSKEGVETNGRMEAITYLPH